MSQQNFSYRKALDIYLKHTKQTMDSSIYIWITSMNKVQKADKVPSADYTKSYRDILLTNNYINQNLSDTESGEEDTSKEQATYKNIKNKHTKRIPNYNVKHSMQKKSIVATESAILNNEEVARMETDLCACTEQQEEKQKMSKIWVIIKRVKEIINKRLNAVSG
ncbi:unnamed protein product [Parnassius apollo]|uniref:(apollo) hypothetical protein n=1 Tax=Parnassius apollo TaxID=110799 RepID=A0A8S3XS01_PARAO|nr:unnamed protein product [Parnassius apollo]